MTKSAPKPREPPPYGYLALCALAIVLANSTGRVAALADTDPELAILITLAMVVGGLALAGFGSDD